MKTAALLLGAAVSGASTLVVLAGDTSAVESLRGALRITGRISFSFFVLAFVAVPLARRKVRLGRVLAAHRVHAFLAFAGSHAVHVGLILALAASAQAMPAGWFVIAATSPKTPYPEFVVGLGALGLCVLGAMATASYRATSAASAAPRQWLHTAGAWLLATIFAYGFILKPLLEGTLGHLAYFPFAALLVVAWALQRLPAPVMHRDTGAPSISPRRSEESYDGCTRRGSAAMPRPRMLARR